MFYVFENLPSDKMITTTGCIRERLPKYADHCSVYGLS